jgi:hypothetical protein
MADLDTYCYRWVSPAIWPHALVDIFSVQTTEDRARVTCLACLHALGSQKSKS